MKKAAPTSKTKKRKSSAAPKTKRRTPAARKPIGRVTHFFGGIGVAIVKFNKNVGAGTMLHFKGATTDFKEAAKSMQYDRKPIAVASKGKEIGIKVKKRVREGDAVYLA